ncbi:MAG: Glu/Leu/Phe/Val family dehydrogenase [Pseudomonadota bacterium]|jgi:leucine dehydrogenase
MSHNGILSKCAERGHEQVVFFNYPEVGLKLIVGIHNTMRGPALGGCRMRIYQSEEQAIDDVLRLSEGMTYKSALADLPLGGGKSCLIADPKLSVGREALFEKLGECLNHLGGRYITAEDMGTSVADMMSIRKVSRYVVGTDPSSGGAGDPSPWTALGVFHAIRAAVDHGLPGKGGVSGKRVAVQGVGHVGMYLVENLVKAGAVVTVTDTNPALIAEAKQRFKVESVAPEAIYDVDCDIFAPCAIGQTINPQTLPRLKCKIIAGAANNQLSDKGVYTLLRERSIVYCPDFAINSGGVICVCAELSKDGPSQAWVQQRVDGIYDTTANILEQSSRTGSDSEAVAYELAKERIAAAKSR